MMSTSRKNSNLVNILKENGVRHGTLFKNLVDRATKNGKSKDIDFDLLDNDEIDFDVEAKVTGKKLFQLNKFEKLLPFTSTPITDRSSRSRTTTSKQGTLPSVKEIDEIFIYKSTIRQEQKQLIGGISPLKDSINLYPYIQDPLKRLFFINKNQQQQKPKNENKIRIASVKSCLNENEIFEFNDKKETKPVLNDPLRNLLNKNKNATSNKISLIPGKNSTSANNKDLLKKLLSQKKV